MSITKTKTPHEFLVRWNDSGSLSGAHVAFREAISEDGTEISSKFLAPEPVAIGGNAGFPLADVLDAIHTTALADVADLKTQVEALTKERDELKSKVGTMPEAVDGVPQVISKRQGRAQLKAEGMLAAVEGFIASLPADNDVRMAYEDASEWNRQDENVLGMMEMLGKTGADADAFFVAASKL